jgi:hypothetical protein
LTNDREAKDANQIKGKKRKERILKQTKPQKMEEAEKGKRK